MLDGVERLWFNTEDEDFYTCAWLVYFLEIPLLLELDIQHRILERVTGGHERLSWFSMNFIRFNAFVDVIEGIRF